VWVFHKIVGRKLSTKPLCSKGYSLVLLQKGMLSPCDTLERSDFSVILCICYSISIEWIMFVYVLQYKGRRIYD
jgi:hypothetical protein